MGEGLCIKLLDGTFGEKGCNPGKFFQNFLFREIAAFWALVWWMAKFFKHLLRCFEVRCEAIRRRLVGMDTLHCQAYLTAADLVKLSRRNSYKFCKKKVMGRREGVGLYSYTICRIAPFFIPLRFAHNPHITRKCFDQFWSLKNS